MGTVGRGTETIETLIGESIRGSTWREVGTGRVPGSIGEKLAFRNIRHGTSVVVMTASVIIWFSTVCREKLECRLLVFHFGADITGTSQVGWMLISAIFGELLTHW